MSYKTTDGLMRHLRENGISIAGSSEKRKLINTGYYHGYKGYRYFKDANKRLPFTSFKEVYATIQYDTALKSLFYDKIMFIETTLKNIALESILVKANSENIQVMYEKVVSGYQNAPNTFTTEQRERLQQNKLNLQNLVQSNLANAYKKNNVKIRHFYNSSSYSDVPIWALFEILTMGDFGFLVSCLTHEMRDIISRRLGLNSNCDTNKQLIYKYIYTLKDLRNAIAHNSVVFDTRFRTIEPTKSMKQCLKMEMGYTYINFKTIGDYVILICYFLKLLKVSNNEIKTFIFSFEEVTKKYIAAVNSAVSSIVVHPDLDFEWKF